MTTSLRSVFQCPTNFLINLLLTTTLTFPWQGSMPFHQCCPSVPREELQLPWSHPSGSSALGWTNPRDSPTPHISCPLDRPFTNFPTTHPLAQCQCSAWCTPKYSWPLGLSGLTADSDSICHKLETTDPLLYGSSTASCSLFPRLYVYSAPCNRCRIQHLLLLHNMQLIVQLFNFLRSFYKASQPLRESRAPPTLESFTKSLNPSSPASKSLMKTLKRTGSKKI